MNEIEARISPGVFVPFGTAHVVALVLTAALAASLSLAARWRPQGMTAIAIRLGLAGLLLAATAVTLAALHSEQRLSPWDLVPLHLCDLLILVAAAAALTRRQALYELLYFWSGGTLLAMLTPDLASGFPDWRFLSYFVLHGTVVATAAILTFGLGMRPSPGGAWRAFLLTNAYAALVGLVNLAFGTNFLYLCRKPGSPTLLDRLGEWPWYVVWADVLALAIFLLMGWPFRRAALPLRG